MKSGLNTQYLSQRKKEKFTGGQRLPIKHRVGSNFVENSLVRRVRLLRRFPVISPEGRREVSPVTDILLPNEQIPLESSSSLGASQYPIFVLERCVVPSVRVRERVVSSGLFQSSLRFSLQRTTSVKGVITPGSRSSCRFGDRWIDSSSRLNGDGSGQYDDEKPYLLPLWSCDHRTRMPRSATSRVGVHFQVFPVIL